MTRNLFLTISLLGFGSVALAYEDIVPGPVPQLEYMGSSSGVAVRFDLPKRDGDKSPSGEGFITAADSLVVYYFQDNGHDLKDPERIKLILLTIHDHFYAFTNQNMFPLEKISYVKDGKVVLHRAWITVCNDKICDTAPAMVTFEGRLAGSDLGEQLARLQ